MPTSRWSVSSSFRALSFAALCLGLALWGLPRVAVAQEGEAPPTLVKHLRNELKAKNPMRRQMALLDVNVLAHCRASCTVSLQSIQGKEIRIENETGAGAVVDLDALIPDLLDSYRRGPATGHQLLALSALLNIGNERALERLLEIDGETPRSREVQRATQRGLAGFYLERYPELMERTQRTRRLSLEDVARAKALRMRKMKESSRRE